MIKIVLLRHGESTWNKKGKFTGWTNVGLTKKGVQEAKKSGKVLKKKGYDFDITFTSVLIRATKTLKIVMNEMRLNKLPVKKSWRLNERHYGALQGLNKKEMAKRFGEKQVHIWRRSYDIRPPALKRSDRRYPGNQKLYNGINKKYLPTTECLKDTVNRFVPYWKKEIVPEIKKNKKILICAHGNSLRALVKYLDNVPDKVITSLNIPTGVPLIYELDKNLNPIKHYFLGDPKEIKKLMEAVANQGKPK